MSSFELLPQAEGGLAQVDPTEPEVPGTRKVWWVLGAVFLGGCLTALAMPRAGPQPMHAELSAVEELIDDIIVLDRCDPNNPKTKGHFCEPGTGKIVEADPCDVENPMVKQRGWWCRRGTSEVIISKDQKAALKKGSRYVYPNTPQGCDYQPVAMINQDYLYECVPCDRNNPTVAGKWCKPRTADLCKKPCHPCDPKNPTVANRGWFCQSKTANVCVDEYGWAVLNPLEGKMVLGSATKKKACNKDALCKWGITGGVAVACAAATACFGSAAIAQMAFDGCSNLAMKSIEAADRSDYDDKRTFKQKLFENPDELIPTPGGGKMKVLAKSWGKGTKTVGGAMMIGLKSSKKFVLKNAKKEGKEQAKKWALGELKNHLGINDDNADKTCGPALRQLPS